jgi:hypothetical protein
MRIPIEVSSTASKVRRNSVLDAALAEPPSSMERNDIVHLIALLLLETHDRGVTLLLSGSQLELRTEHARVVVTLPGALDVHNVRAAAEHVGVTLETS